MLSFKRRKSTELPSFLKRQSLSEELGKLWHKGEGFAILSLVGEPWSFNEQICFARQVRPNFSSVANQAIINMGLS